MPLKQAVQAVAKAAKAASNTQVPKEEREKNANAAAQQARDSIAPKNAKQTNSRPISRGVQVNQDGSTSELPGVGYPMAARTGRPDVNMLDMTPGQRAQWDDLTQTAHENSMDELQETFGLPENMNVQGYVSPDEYENALERYYELQEKPKPSNMGEVLDEEERRAEDLNFLQENQGHALAYETYLDSLPEGEEPMPFRNFVEERLANEINPKSEAFGEPVYYTDFDEVQLWNDFMNDPENEVAQEWLRSRGLDEFDYYNDYADLATSGDAASENVWAGAYSDETMGPGFYVTFGEEFDTDHDGRYSEAEGREMWNHGREFTPETLDPYNFDDEQMHWIYGQGQGYGDSGQLVSQGYIDVYNNAFQRDRVIEALMDGSYEDLVDQGLITQVLDADGNDAVYSYGLDKDVEAVKENLDDAGNILEGHEEQYESAMATLYADAAEYNNLYKLTEVNDYYAANPEYHGQLIDYGGFETPAVMEVPDVGSGLTAEDMNQRAFNASQTAGMNALLNNVAGGNSGVYIADTTGANRWDDSAPAAWYNEGDNTLYQELYAPADNNIDISQYSGSSTVTPELAYVMMNRGFNPDDNINVYTDAHRAQTPEVMPEPSEDEQRYSNAAIRRSGVSPVSQSAQSRGGHSRLDDFSLSEFLQKHHPGGTTAEPIPDIYERSADWVISDPTYSSSR